MTATAAIDTYMNFGVYNEESAPMMTGVTATASDGMHNSAVYNYSSSPTMTGVTATASGGADKWDVYNYYSSATIHSRTLSAAARTSGSCGMNTSDGSSSHIVKIDNSQVTGSTVAIVNSSAFTTHIGASQLVGTVEAGGGTVTCAGVYDENYVFYANECP